MSGRRGLPSPALLLAAVALIAALAGSAVAIDKITSRDIKRNAVRSKHIKGGHVRASDTDITTSRFAGSFLADNSATLPELNLALRVKRGDLVALHGFAVARDAAGPGNDSCRLALDVNGPGIADEQIALRFDTAAFVRRGFDGTADGTTNFVAEDDISILVPAAGTLRIKPSFVGGPLSDCELRTRGLAASIHR